MDSSKTLQVLRHPIRQCQNYRARRNPDVMSLAIAAVVGAGAFHDVQKAIQAELNLALSRYTELRGMTTLNQKEAWELYTTARKLEKALWIDDEGDLFSPELRGETEEEQVK